MRSALVVLPLVLAACTAPAAQPPTPSTDALQVDTGTGAGDTAPRAPADDERAARSAVRRFLRAYLAYSYGAGTAALEGAPAAPGLVAALAATPPDVPHVVRARTPRVERIALTWFGPDAASATTTVADGAATYPVSLRLVRDGAGFLVVDLGP